MMSYDNNCNVRHERERGCPVPPSPVDYPCASGTPDKEQNKIREIGIREVNSGYIVTVGCHTFAIESKVSLISKLSSYISNPQETEKEWFAGTLF